MPYCPYCPALLEMADHFLTCGDNPGHWNTLLPMLKDIYEKNKINPILYILRDMVVLNKSISAAKTQHPKIDWSNYKKLIDTQSVLGWEQVKYDRWSLRWHSKQQDYEVFCKGTTDQGTPKWTRKVIKAIWIHAHNH
eukprot:13631521-Ditylum_brightwellii.AAC.1